MTNPFKVLPVAATLAGMAFAGSANAQALPQKMSITCSNPFGPFCAYDVGGNLMGIPFGPERLIREINGQVYYAPYDTTTFITQLALFYNSPDCSGPPLIQFGNIGPDAQSVVVPPKPALVPFDGTHFWGPTGPTRIAKPQCNVCYGFVCNGNTEGVPTPYSAVIAPFYPAYAPAAVIETPKLAAPTAACEAAQNCVSVK